MAVADLDVRVRRTALLLRCQLAREHGRRLDLARAEHRSRATDTAERAAAEVEAAGKAASAEHLRHSFGDLGGRVMDPTALAALPFLKQELDRDDAELEGRTAAAAEEALAARRTVAEARALLLRESRSTEKRSKLAKQAQTLLRRGLDAVEEAERDAAAADAGRWQP